MTVASAVGIALELGCNYDEACAQLARHLLEQLDSGRYDRCSILPIPGSVDEWLGEHRTARKRVWRSQRQGFVADVLHRERHIDDIYEINTSARRRQGRPMAPGYMVRTEFSPLPEYACGRHAIRTTGVFLDGKCFAYLLMRRCGDLALISMLLGHHAYLEDGITYALFAKALEREIDHGPGFVVYNRHDSGTDGLRFWKERCGFREEPVEWLP